MSWIYDNGLFKFKTPFVFAGGLYVVLFFLSFIIEVLGIISATVFSILILVLLASCIQWARNMYETGYVEIPSKPYKFALIILEDYYREGVSPFYYISKKLKKRNGEDENWFERLPIPLYQPGNRFLLFYPWFQNFVLVDVSSQSYTETIDEVRTSKDQVDSKVMFELAFFIHDFRKFTEYAGFIKEKTEKNHFDKVEKILVGMIAQAIRELAEKDGAFPETWEDAAGAGTDFVKSVLLQISEEDGLEENITLLKKGNGNVKVKGLGITVSRFNITEVKADEAVTKAKESVDIETRKIEKERIQKISERVERLGVIRGIKDYMKAGLSAEMAANLVQTERGKATRFIIDGGGANNALAMLNLSGSSPLRQQDEDEKDDNKKKRKGGRS